MDVRTYLAELGYSKEDQDAILADDRNTKALAAAAKKYDEGTAALAKADADKKETATFWEQKTTELQGSVQKLTKAERRAAEAEADAARVRAYNKSLAEQGYDIPKEMYEVTPGGANPANPANQQDPNTGKYISREDFAAGRRSTVDDLAALTEISNRYAYLHGKPYLTVKADLEDARKQNKPLSDYVSQKYDFSGRQAALDQKAADDAYKVRHEADLAKEKAEWAKTNGSNPETRSPVPSSFDTLSKQPGFKSDSWKTPAGRDDNRKARLKQFENLTIN